MAIKYKSKYKHSSGFVYNKAYYVLIAILSSKKYQKHLKQILQKIEETGYIIPVKRVSKSIQTYNISSIIDELLTKGVDIAELSSNVLSDFGIKDSNINADYYDYLEGIINKILYNQSPSFKLYGFPNYRYDNEKNPTELWIQIYPWTTKKIYDSYFPFITILKEKLLNSIHKIKPWETFQRDLEIYKLYLRVKNNLKKGIIKKERALVLGYNIKISKSICKQMVLYSEYKEIKKKFPLPEFDDESVARLVSDTQKKLDNIQLL